MQEQECAPVNHMFSRAMFVLHHSKAQPHGGAQRSGEFTRLNDDPNRRKGGLSSRLTRYSGCDSRGGPSIQYHVTSRVQDWTIVATCSTAAVPASTARHDSRQLAVELVLPKLPGLP
jgi:hypothetical protein